jgi:hypothetical protein
MPPPTAGCRRILEIKEMRVCVVLVLWCLMPLSTIFHLFMTVSFFSGGNRSTRRKPLTCRKSLTNGRHLGVSYRVCNMFFNTNSMQFLKYLLLFTYVFVIKQICFPHGKFVTKKDSDEKYFLVNLCT